VSSADGHLYAIDSKGYLRWKFKTKDLTESSPVIAEDGTIIVGSGDNKLYAVNSDGTLKWTFTAADAVRSSPAIGTDGIIYVGSADNRLYAITPDGKQKWALTTGSWVVGSPAIICPTCLLAQTEKRTQKAVKVYKIHVEYDLYEDGELVLSDIVEVNPKFLSEDFRNSIIQKIEYTLLGMVEKRGPMAQTEMPAAVLEKLEKKLTTGVGELNGSKEGAR